MGTVYLVGAGPGDPKLCTIRGLELIRSAEVIVYDYLASPRLVAQRKPDARAIYVGKRPGRHAMKQDDINRLLVDLAGELESVVRLKGGDPFIFGRGGEEALALSAAGVSFEVVPGITAGVAAPAYAGIPLTHRGIASTALLVTGHEEPREGSSGRDLLSPAAGRFVMTGPATPPTLVVYMGVRNIELITKAIIDTGRAPETPAAVVAWGSTAEQKTITERLDSIAALCIENAIEPPAILVVGNVVELRDKLRWYDTLPLFGKRILVTRSIDQQSVLVDELESRGAGVIVGPTIEIHPPESFDELDRAIERLAEYMWVIFTSQNSVKYLFERLEVLGYDARFLAGTRCAAIGKVTARALKARGIRADLIPQKENAEGLLDAFDAKSEALEDSRVLFPCSSESRDTLPRGLESRGAVVDRVIAYEVSAPGETADFVRTAFDPPPDLVSFTSPSTVRNLIDLLKVAELGDLYEDIPAATIGPVTASVARTVGFRVVVEAQEASEVALVNSIETYFEG